MGKQIVNRTAPYEAIKEAVYERYIKNALETGGKLPSDRELAKEYGVSIVTVSKSVSALALEGLVERRVGSGSYIVPKIKPCVMTGIYLGAAEHPYTRPELVFFSKLDQWVQSTLYKGEKSFLHYADMRIPELWGNPHPAILADIEAGKLSDLIVVCANAADYGWLDKLPVNVVGFGIDYKRGTVDVDAGAFSRQSVDFLYQQGCRNIGLISEAPVTISKRAKSLFAIHESFHDGLHEHGLTADSALVVAGSADFTRAPNVPLGSEIFGYNAFKQVWSAPIKPDGLVIHADIVGLGVIRAAQELGVDLDRDLKTVFWANHENAWPPLQSQIRMSFSIQEMANSLIKLVGNSTPQSILIKPFLVRPDCP